jgi:hypothetical protein
MFQFDQCVYNASRQGFSFKYNYLDGLRTSSGTISILIHRRESSTCHIIALGKLIELHKIILEVQCTPNGY